MGKTTLLNGFLSRLDARQQATLRIECSPVEEVPYGSFMVGLMRFIEQNLHRPRSYMERLASVVAGLPSVGPLAERVFDQRDASVFHRALGRAHPPEDIERYYGYAQLVRENAGNRPTIVVVDDLQWMRADEWGLLEFLADIGLADRAFFLVAIRNRMVTSALEEASYDRFDAWTRRVASRLTLIDIPPLSMDEITRIVKHHRPSARLDREDLADLYGSTGGNPLHVIELLRQTRQAIQGEPSLTGPPLKVPLSQLARQRIEYALGTNPKAREVLGYAAVVGERFDTGPVLALARVTPIEGSAILNDLGERHGIITCGDPPGWCRFDHANTWSVAYGMFEPVLPALHDQVGEYLQKIAPRNPRLVAFHYRRGRDPLRAIPWLLETLEAATRNRLLGTVRETLMEIEAFGPEALRTRDGTIARNCQVVAEALQALGKFEESRGYLDTADDFLPLAASEVRARQQFLSGIARYRVGSKDDRRMAASELEAAWMMFDELHLENDAFSVRLHLGAIYDNIGDDELAERNFEILWELTQKLDDPHKTALVYRRSPSQLDFDVSRPLLEKAVRVFRGEGSVLELAMTLNNLGSEFLHAGMPGEAKAALGESLGHFDSLGGSLRDSPLINLGVVSMMEGDWGTALELETQALSKPFGRERELFAEINRSIAFRKMGDPGQARDVLLTIADDVRRHDEAYMADCHAFNLAATLSDLGEYERALKELDSTPVFHFRDEAELAETKRKTLRDRVLLAPGKKGSEPRMGDVLEATTRPAAWLYRADYYPCDAQFWSF